MAFCSPTGVPLRRGVSRFVAASVTPRPLRHHVSQRTVRACAEGLPTSSPAKEAADDDFPTITADHPMFSGPPWSQPDYIASPPEFGSCGVDVSDAMEFFRHREGKWSSWRVTHHLAFRRSESGTSEISMTCLEKDDEKITSLLDDNDVPRELAVGGCYVTWKATLAWDQEGENHEGSTVFALVPDADDKRRGRIIRDRGYAEVVPIAGRYCLDVEDALCLETPYDGGAVEERFMFDGPDRLHRVSTVRRFGGLSSATFATENRIENKDGSPASDGSSEVELTDEELDVILSGDLHFFGGRSEDPSKANEDATTDASDASQGSFLGGTSARLAAAAAASRAGSTAGRPSANSAFGSGFSSSAPAPPRGEQPKEPSKAEKQAGIDLSKVPPSMRADFEKSLDLDSKPSEGSGDLS